MERVFDEMPFWRRVYQTVSGNYKSATVEDVNTLLDTLRDQLVRGIRIFRRWRGDNPLWNQFVRDKPELHRIVRRSARASDNDILITWAIFRNYLTYDYHGRPADIEGLSANEMQLTILLQNYQQFYCMERMYLLKTVHHIFSNYNNHAHRLQRCYMRFVSIQCVLDIRTSLLKQYVECQRRLQIELMRLDQPRFVRYIHEIKEICIILTASAWAPFGRIHFESGETFGLLYEPLMLDLYMIWQEFHNKDYGYSPEFQQLISHPDLLDFHYCHIAALIVPMTELWKNFNLWDDYRDRIDRLYEDSRYIPNNDYMLIFLLHWSLLLLTSPMDYDRSRTYVEEHRAYIDNAMRRGAMVALASFVNDSTMVRDIEEGYQIRMSVYRLFQELYRCVQADDGLYGVPGVVPLLIALMDNNIIGREILTSENGIGGTADFRLNRIIGIVDELFPFDFIFFSKVIHAMMKIDAYREIALMKLKNLRHFAEQRWEDSVFFVNYNYYPLRNDMIVVRPVQQAIVARRRDCDVHIYVTDKYLYLDILHLLIVRYLRGEERSAGPRITNDSYVLAIISGMDVMLDILEHHEAFSSNPSFIACMNYVFSILQSTVDRNNAEFNISYIHELVMCCLKLCAKLMRVMPDKVVSFLRGIRLIPAVLVNYNTSQGPATRQNMFVHGILDHIINTDMAQGRADVIDVYIEIVQHSIRTGTHYQHAQLPMTVLLFETILVKFQLDFYEYSSSDYRIRSLTKIVELMQQILVSEPTAEPGRKLKKQTYRLLLNHGPVIRLFLHAAVHRPNLVIEGALLLQLNWSAVAKCDVVRLAKKCISIILLLIKKTGTCTKLTHKPFGAVLVRVRPNSVDYIHILAGLIDHGFDPELRQAALRLLIKFAQNEKLKLLAHLRMDAYQVRCAFLEKLRDPMEENYNKVAIIDLISASVQSQNALTCAFFNFPKFLENRSADFNDSVVSFIAEHMENVDRIRELRSSIIHAAILNLLDQLWTRGVDLVTVPLTFLPNFWTSLTVSLFDEFARPHDICRNIINVIVSQLNHDYLCLRANTAKFIGATRELFLPKKDSWILKLICYVRECLLRTCQEDVLLVTSIRNLIRDMTRFHPEFFESTELKGDIAFSCLQGLSEYIKNPVEPSIVETWMCLYHHLMTVWGDDCYTNYESDTITILTDVLNYYAINFNVMSARVKQTIFTVGYNMVAYLKAVINSEPRILWEFLQATRRIIEIEEKDSLHHIEHHVKEISHIDYWVMLMLFHCEVLKLECVEAYRAWFTVGNFCKHVMTIAGVYMVRPKSVATAATAMQTLAAYVKSDMLGTVTIADMETFFRKAQPPKELLEFNPYEIKLLHNRPYEDFWKAYMSMVQLNIAMLRVQPVNNFDKCAAYFRMHWEVLNAIMKLPSVTVEVKALSLVESVLEFGSEMLVHKDEWNNTDLGPKMIEEFFVMVRMCINSCTQIMISPNIIKFFTRDTTLIFNIDKVPNVFYVDIIEQILTILSKACACYNKASPSHIDLMASEKIVKKLVGSNVIDVNFSIPKISGQVNTKLSYGDLLFLHQVLVQILFKVHNKPRAREKPPTVDPFIDPDTGNDSDSTIDLRRKIDKERKLLHQERKSIMPVSAVGTFRYEYWGLVCPDYVHRGVTDWTSRRMHEPEVSGMSAPWLDKINELRVLSSLEALTTLLGSEIHIYLGNYDPRSTELVFYRRHFGTELQMFHDYIRKWRCGNISLGNTLADLVYIRQIATTFASSSDAHTSLVPPIRAAEVDPSDVFCFEHPLPNRFGQQDNQHEDINHFFDPADAEELKKNENKEALINNYLLMLSHWLHYVCNSSD